MTDEVAALRPLPHLHRDSEVTEQLTNLLSHFLAMNDQVDEAVFLQKLGGLKSFRQLLMSGFFDHPRPGKTDHAFGLSDNNVAQRSEAGHDSSRSRICKNRNIWEPFLGVPGESAACFCHLHQPQHSFVHARPARGSTEDDPPALSRPL